MSDMTNYTAEDFENSQADELANLVALGVGGADGSAELRVAYVYDRKGYDEYGNMNNTSSYRGNHKDIEVHVVFRVANYSSDLADVFINRATGVQKAQDAFKLEAEKAELDAAMSHLQNRFKELDEKRARLGMTDSRLSE